VDRCALFVDAGYVLADGAMAVHGTRQRDSVSWDYAGLVKLLTGVSRDRTGLPILRCYWYEATLEGRRNSEHNALADLPGVKLRMGRMRPGRREGVEAEMHRDLTTLARNHAVSDAVVVSAEEDLAEVVAEVQDLGLRVIIVHIAADGNWTVSRPLRQECDDIVEITAAHLRPFVDLIAGAEPAGHDDQYRNGSYQRGALSNGHGPGPGALTHQGLPAAALPAPPAIYTGPVVEEYQRTAQPSGQGPLALSALAAAAAVGPPTHHPPAANRSSEPGRGQAAVQDQAGSPDLGPAQPQGVAAQAVQPQAPAPAAAQDQAGPADPALVSQPLAAPTPPPGYGTQPGDQMSGPAGYAYMPGPGPDDPRSAGGPARDGRQGGPAGAHAALPPAVQQAPAPQQNPPQPAPGPQDLVPQDLVRQSPVQQNSVQQNSVPQNSVHQNSVPQNFVPPNMAPRNALPRRAVQQNPVANGMPQDSLPQNSMPQNHVPQGPVSPAQAPQGRPPQHAPAEPGPLQQAGQNSLPPAMSPAPVPQPLPPGQGEPRYVPGQGDYRPPDQAGPRGGLANSDRMAPPGPESPGHQFAGSGPPGRFADSPPAPAQGRFAENGRFGEGPASGRFPEGPAQARFGEGPAPARFAEGPGPAAYQPAPPGAYDPGGPVQGQYPQFPGSQPPGQHAASGPDPGYNAAPRDQGPYSGPQSAAHAALAQPVPQPVAVSLADAVQAAHAEGFGFGDAVARDAPALWLEAVLARKPRMPSDLEARLLQGSALPIDSLLHDEVRHSLRRGFWDALERSRR
jgi:hypothetical protein